MSKNHKNEKVFDPKKAANLDSPERRARIPAAAIIEAARPFPGMRVVDVGSGTGYYLFALLNSTLPPAAVHAVDASPQMNEMFRNRLKEHPFGSRVEVHESIGEQLPIADHSFDLVMMGNVFHEFDDPPRALAESLRVLKKGGRVLIIDWAVPADLSKEPEAGPPYHHRRSEQDVKRELVSAGFTHVEAHPGFKDTYALSAVRP